MVAVSTCESTVVSLPLLSPQNIQPHEKSPTSHRAQGVLPPTVSLALGANREGKRRIKGKACVCVCVYVCVCIY